MRASVAFAAALASHPTLTGLSLTDVDSDSGFATLALAFQQNKSLTTLDVVLDKLALTTEINDGIRCLISTNSVEQLGVHNSNTEERTLDLSGVLCGNETLKGLRLQNMKPDDDSGMSLSEGTVRDLCHLLRTNQNVLEIGLGNVEFRTGEVELIALAATGHTSLECLILVDTNNSGHELSLFDAKAIGSMLGNTPTLKKFTLTSFDCDADHICIIFNGLKSKNSKLEQLTLRYMDMFGNDCASFLADILETNGTIAHLNLGGNEIGDEGAQALARMLQRNSTIEHVDLKRNEFGPKRNKCNRRHAAPPKLNKDIALGWHPNW